MAGKVRLVYADENGVEHPMSMDAEGRMEVSLRERPTIARKVAAGVASQDVALSPTCKRVAIYGRNAGIRFEIGVGPQVANASTSHFIGAEHRFIFEVLEGSHIAAIRTSSEIVNGTLEITELE